MEKILTVCFCFFHFLLNAQNPGDNIFSNAVPVHNVYITFPVSTWYDTLTSYYNISNMTGDNLYYTCDLQFDTVLLTNAGIRFKGNSSYSHPNQKKSFKLDFEEFVNNQVLDNLHQLNLHNGYNDPTFMRERLYLAFCEANMLDAPRCSYTNVYINGSLWGFYTVVEEVDKVFLDTHFGDDVGNLFKGDPHGTFEWEGPSQSAYYNNFELKTNESLNDWSDLVKLHNEINFSTPLQFIDSVNAVFDLYKYMEHYAATMTFCTLDSYTGSGHNFYVYHDSTAGKFRFIQWDTNGSFGRHKPAGQGLVNLEYLQPFWTPSPAGVRPLHEKILQNASLKQLFADHICNYITNYLDTVYYSPAIDSLANLIRPYVYADPRKQFTNADFETNQVSYIGTTPGLKNFISDRHDYLSDTLASWGCAATFLNENSGNEMEFSVFPNPAREELTLQFGLTDSNHRLVISDLFGRNVVTENILHNQQWMAVDVSKLPSGVYLVWAEGEKKSQAKKLIIE